MEMEVTSIVRQVQQQAAVAYEMSPRLLADHLHTSLLEEPCRYTLKRLSWRSAAKALTNALPGAISYVAIRALLGSKGNFGFYFNAV